MTASFVPLNDTHLGLMNTASGKMVDIANPCVDMITIEDIAVGLSNTCRFSGQLNRFYSVAQHSFLVYLLAPQELKLAALLHDASEAYIHDIAKPLKVMLGEVYEEIESQFMQVISERFNIPQWQLDAVKYYDKQALTIEHDHLRAGNSTEWTAIWNHHHYLKVSHESAPEIWRAFFLHEFYLLTQ